MKKIRWVLLKTVLKAAEGGPGTTWMIQTLKYAGIRACSAQSAFIGHSNLYVEKGKVIKAKKLLPR
jgi:hypothetical protein